MVSLVRLLADLGIDAPYKCPRAIGFLEVLPRTSNGKVQRFVLRELARA